MSSENIAHNISGLLAIRGTTEFSQLLCLFRNEVSLKRFVKMLPCMFSILSLLIHGIFILVKGRSA